MPENKDRYEVVMAGSGGQGLIVSGIILAEAAMLEGKNVVQTQSYGIASRGGFSQAEVIIDKGEIIYQQVESLDIALALTEEAVERYAPLAPSGTPVFYDTSLLRFRPGENLYGFPFTEMGAGLGHVGTANMIALGAMSAVTGMVSPESLTKVIGTRFSGKTAELNIKALHAGTALPGSDRLQTVPSQKPENSISANGTGPKAAAGAQPIPLDLVAVNSSVCKQCGYCREVCPTGVFEISESFNPSGYRPMVAAHEENCSGCLKCLMVCPDFAITVSSSPRSRKSRLENTSKENAS